MKFISRERSIKTRKEPVSIEEVNSGLQENIVCACCGAKLVANKGQKKAWHFSHYFDEACVLAYETQLHLTAKEFFARTGKIPVPLEAGWIHPDCCTELKISDVQIEVYMDGRRPDLIVEVGSELYWVEIANKHKCDSKKVWDCRSHDRNVIEIDVSDCGHLDQFNSLDHCLVRVQSLNICNDYLDEIASNTASKHETVRKQFEALTRSQKQLVEKESKQEKAEKTLEERIEAQQKKHEERLEKMKLRESAQDEILAELERAIDVHKECLSELETRKANLEKELNERSQLKLTELEERNKVTLQQLKAEFEALWQQELNSRREQFEQELSEEFQRRFQSEIDIMNIRKFEHKQLANQLKLLAQDKAVLKDEIDALVINQTLIKEQQERDINAQLRLLIDQKNTLSEQVMGLSIKIKEKLFESDLADTYINNFEEVKEFYLARTDYGNALSQRMQEFKNIDAQCQNLQSEYDQKIERLDVIVKLTNDLTGAIKSSFNLLQRKELIQELPEVLVERISKNSLLLPRNAQEEIDDFERMKV